MNKNRVIDATDRLLGKKHPLSLLESKKGKRKMFHAAWADKRQSG